jgi:hypothetical protein
MERDYNRLRCETTNIDRPYYRNQVQRYTYYR